MMLRDTLSSLLHSSYLVSTKRETDPGPERAVSESRNLAGL